MAAAKYQQQIISEVNMPSLWKCCLFIYIFHGADLISSTEANVFIDNCVNTTQLKSSSCIKSYGELYNTLASLDNSFKIESALYPAMEPSSVLVKVTLYGTNGTETTAPIHYTWSLSCLYVAIPAAVLELWSLGSIIVRPRTQELNITIPLFCCNVSERGKKIKHVLAALQDLAVSPGLRDARLNTAECVVEGHEPTITGTGPGRFTEGMLWCSFVCTVISSFVLAVFLRRFILVLTKLKDKQIQLIMASVKWLCVLLSLLELVMWFIAFAVGLGNGNYIFIIIELGNLVASGCIALYFKYNFFCDMLSWSAFLWINPTVHHFCWLVIGIMMNPTWGLAVLLLVCIVLAAFTFAVFWYLKKSNDGEGADIKCSWDISILFYVFGLGAVYLFAVTVYLAGKSFYGRDTADEVVKLVLLYLISGFISVFLSKKE